MKKLFENWRKWNKTLNEDWYSDEHETRADKEFADSMDPGATHSSYSEDPEFDQIHDISLDSLESNPMGRNSNLDISDIARRLEAQSFDVEINAADWTSTASIKSGLCGTYLLIAVDRFLKPLSACHTSKTALLMRFLSSLVWVELLTKVPWLLIELRLTTKST